MNSANEGRWGDPWPTTYIGSTSDGVKLKPCPFCGGTNVERLDEFSIGCHDCHLITKLWGWGFDLPREITDKWNRRVRK